MPLRPAIYLHHWTPSTKRARRNPGKARPRSASATLTYDQDYFPYSRYGRLLASLSACSTPYSASGPPIPTKGKALAAYQLGQSDAAKRQYWIARNLQTGKQNREEVTYKTRFYTFNIQPDPQANINRVPYNVTLPILE